MAFKDMWRLPDGSVHCLHHQPAVRLFSKTEASMGRVFYKCSKPRGDVRNCGGFVWEDDVQFLQLWTGDSSTGAHSPDDSTSPGSTVTLASQPSTPNRLPRTTEVQRDTQVAEGSTSKAKPTIIDLLLTPPPSNLKGKGKGKRKFDESEDAPGEGSPTPAKRTRGDHDNELEQAESALSPLALNVPPTPREGGDVRMRPSAPEDHRMGTQEGAGSNNTNTGVPIADPEDNPFFVPPTRAASLLPQEQFGFLDEKSTEISAASQALTVQLSSLTGKLKREVALVRGISAAKDQQIAELEQENERLSLKVQCLTSELTLLKAQLLD
ncbi:hypothetical protein PC9H_005475 [Pleurotus ostreatus]|uniref:GRF-type domain-containing protein n=1 Tax=Pleurotus ostreatus TaxID=5322 RepID=A0A8H6ZZZ2_PLEOS|nr:uncharacterized protein PC9H_005475 [Pleurotus ostreatus]KAF7433519.1 hypothetical protein PC9H_005475 [Pleurotus ostreatus]